jgi:hypothetical protein
MTFKRSLIFFCFDATMVHVLVSGTQTRTSRLRMEQSTTEPYNIYIREWVKIHCKFDSFCKVKNRGYQLRLEILTSDAGVPGSIPGAATIFFLLSFDLFDVYLYFYHFALLKCISLPLLNVSEILKYLGYIIESTRYIKTAVEIWFKTCFTLHNQNNWKSTQYESCVMRYIYKVHVADKTCRNESSAMSKILLWVGYIQLHVVLSGSAPSICVSLLQIW